MTVVSDTRVITTGDRRISSVDLAAGRVDWSQEFATEDEPCPWVTASVELGTLYCGDLFGQIEERSLDTGAPTERSFDPQLGFVGTHVGRRRTVRSSSSSVAAAAITRWKLDGSGAVTRVIAPGWLIREKYSPTGSSLIVARRTDGVESWGDYREFAVLDTRTGS